MRNHALIFLAILSFCFHPSLSAETLPISAFTKHGDYLDMSLSPDGKHILARTRIKGRVVLVFLDSKTMEVVGGVKPPNRDEIHSAVWINNERIVYQFREKHHTSDRPVPTGELFAVNVDGSRQSMLFGYRAGEMTTGTRLKKREKTNASADLISPLVGDKKHVLIAEYPFTIKGNTYYINWRSPPTISRLNVYSGLKRKVEAIPFANSRVYATDSGDIRFVSYLDDNGDTNTVYRENDEDEWKAFELDSVEDLSPIALSKDGDNIFFSGDIGEQEYDTIYQFNLTTQTLTPLFENLSADIERFSWDPSLNMPVVGESMPAKMTYHYAGVKSKTARYHKALSEVFEGKRIHIPSQSEDGNQLLLHISSDINPGEYYLFDTQTNQAAFLWANRSWLDPRTLLPKTPIEFESADGLAINGYLTLPKGENEQSHPLVIMVHGGPYGIRDHWDFESETQLLANRGFAVLQVNYRGSGGYGDKFVRAGHRQWGGLMIQDMLDGIAHVAKEYPVDAERICAYGASYGGYAALMLSVKAPELFKCTVGYVGVYDMNFMYTESDIPNNPGGLAYLNRVIGTDQDELYAYSPVNFAEKIKANVMLIHGNKDVRVSVKNSEKMKANLEAVGKSVEYLNFSKAGHGVYGEAEREDLYTNLVRFLEDNLMKSK